MSGTDENYKRQHLQEHNNICVLLLLLYHFVHLTTWLVFMSLL